MWEVSVSCDIKKSKLTKQSKKGLGFSVRQLGHIDGVGPVGQREFDGGIVELLDMWASAFVILYFFNSDNLDRVSTGTMTGSHITVALSDSSRHSQVAVLTVHVVGSGARVITQPDTEVLNLQWSLFMDLLDADNFASGFLELAKLSQEVPETGFGNNVVRSKNPHAVQRRIGLLLGRQLASDDFVFLKQATSLHFPRWLKSPMYSALIPCTLR